MLREHSGKVIKREGFNPSQPADGELLMNLERVLAHRLAEKLSRENRPVAGNQRNIAPAEELFRQGLAWSLRRGMNACESRDVRSRY